MQAALGRALEDNVKINLVIKGGLTQGGGD